MRTTKYFAFAALGVAAYLWFTSDTAKEMRAGLKEKAMRNAKKWKSKLARMGNDTTETLADLKQMLGNEIEGLSDDARRRIETILDESAKSGGKLKANLSKQLS